MIWVLVAAAGCGGGGEGADGEDETLTFWTAEDLPERVEATKRIVGRFQEQSGIQVQVVPIAEDQLAIEVQAASAGGTLPDVMGALSLGLVHTLAGDGLTDPDAAAEVIQRLGRDTFSKRALSLVEAEGKPVAVPSDTWTQLLVYRKDLFDQAGLQPPDTFDRILAAATKLNRSPMAGIVAATAAGDSFTQQTFEYLALANGCQLADDQGDITLASPPCAETFRFYGDLITKGSIAKGSTEGAQDADSSRTAYLSGRAAMVVWSSFLLDELAGLDNDFPPTCEQCRADRRFLSDNSGVVTAVIGPSGGQPTEFGEVTNFSIIKDGNTEPAKRFVEYMMGDGYVDWLAFAPEGKFPTRAGTKDDPDQYREAWGRLQAGVDTKAPLSALYPVQVLDALTNSTDTMSRWGFPQGQGRLIGAQLAELPIPKALAAHLDGQLTADAAAKQAQADVEEIAQSLR